MKTMVIGLLALLAVSLAAAAAPFEPVPAARKEAYRFNLGKNFYRTKAEWRADLKRAEAMAIKIKTFRGKLLGSPSTLLTMLNDYRDLDDLMVKLLAYGEFRAAIDTKDRAAFDTYQQLEAGIRAKTSFIDVELKNLTQEKMKEFIKAEPALAPYRYMLEAIVRNGPYTLSEGKESILAKLGPDLTSWQSVLFQQVFDRTDFPTIKTGGKNLNVHIDYETLLKSNNRKVRETAFKDYYSSLEKIGDLLGFALYHEMKNYNDQARMRGFRTYYNESLFDRYLTRKQIDNLYTQIEARLPLYHRYQRYRMDQVKKELGVKKAEIWDMDIPPKGSPQPRYTADEAVKLVKASLSVLGPEYSTELDKLLNPENGRMDLVGGPNRGAGAFTEGFYGFFVDNYQGFLTDVSTIAHESGHVVHYRLVVNNRHHILFADGPAYMTESFAMFNELLLRDHLLKTTKDPALHRAIEQNTVNEMMYLWELARRAKFEMVSYDRVASGTITGEKGFDRACEDTGRLYDLWFSSVPQMKVQWIRKHHYWDVPTYYVNYVLAQVLCLTYYDHYLKNPAAFSRKYVAMVRNGFDRPASQLLKDYLNIDLGDPALLNGAFKIIKKNFDLLREGDRKQPGSLLKKRR